MKIGKVEKLVANLRDKAEYVFHVRNVNQVLDHRFFFFFKKKKVHRVIKFNQNAWLKPYIDMNSDLRKKAKTDFENFFLIVDK